MYFYIIIIYFDIKLFFPTVISIFTGRDNYFCYKQKPINREKCVIINIANDCTYSETRKE